MNNETHRTINTYLALGAICLVVILAIATRHTIEDCETKLYEKITEKKYHDK